VGELFRESQVPQAVAFGWGYILPGRLLGRLWSFFRAQGCIDTSMAQRLFPSREIFSLPSHCLDTTRLLPSGSTAPPQGPTKMAFSSAVEMNIRLSVKKVRYDKDQSCVFSCAGPVVEVWDPTMRTADGASDAANALFGGSLQRSGGGSSSGHISTATEKGFFAYSPSEEGNGFEIGSSAALPCLEDDEIGGVSSLVKSKGSGNGGGNSGTFRRSLHGANPSKNRDGAPVNVIVLDIKYIKVPSLNVERATQLKLVKRLLDA